MQGRQDIYTVALHRGVWSCQCISYEIRHAMCRHIRAVAMLQKLTLLDKEAVDLLEQLTKRKEAAMR